MSLTIIKCEKCGRVVCNACYCEWTPGSVVTIPSTAKPFDPILELFHELWNELHTEVRTKEQFENWVARVPSFGCGCASWLRDYITANPPTDDLQVYGFCLHNVVNAKLGKPEFSLVEFEEKYGTV
jgi:hypothetical protein